jgi:broad specificity phosphatase PhoE
MGDLYLIRHAQASFGKPDYDELSDLGLTQARLLADFFERTGRSFDALYCGEMKRHRDTAAALSQKPALFTGNPAPRLLSEFNEFDLATVVNRQLPLLLREKPSLEADLEKLFTDPHILYQVLNLSLSRWINNPEGLEGVETWPAFTRRVREGLSRIIRESGKGKTVALVTSGGPLAALLQKALSLPDLDAVDLAWQIRNASVSTFKFSEERLTLSSYNSVAYLELQRDPSLITYR